MFILEPVTQRKKLFKKYLFSGFTLSFRRVKLLQIDSRRCKLSGPDDLIWTSKWLQVIVRKRQSVPHVDFAGRGQNVFKEDMVDQHDSQHDILISPDLLQRGGGRNRIPPDGVLNVHTHRSRWTDVSLRGC